VHDELQPELGMELRLVQLIADNSWGETFAPGPDGELQSVDYRWMHSPEGLARLATIVDGIGPQLDMLVSPRTAAAAPQPTALLAAARAQGLLVHPYTFRAEAEALPAYAASFEELLGIFLWQVGVDGVFTDFPQRTRQVVDRGAP
jgi:glycerophosphoryl diester phosphodiesterase